MPGTCMCICKFSLFHKVPGLKKRGGTSIRRVRRHGLWWLPRGKASPMSHVLLLTLFLLHIMIGNPPIFGNITLKGIFIALNRIHMVAKYGGNVFSWEVMLSCSLKGLSLDACLAFCTRCLKEENSGQNRSHSGLAIPSHGLPMSLTWTTRRFSCKELEGLKETRQWYTPSMFKCPKVVRIGCYVKGYFLETSSLGRQPDYPCYPSGLS